MYSRPVDSKQFKLTAITGSVCTLDLWIAQFKLTAITTLLDWPTILRDGERWLTFTGLK